MNMVDVMRYYDEIEDLLEDSKKNLLFDMYDSLQFKMNKNEYHYARIQQILSQSDILESEDFYKETHLPLYFEIESLFVSLRSTVDIILHIINNSFDLKLENSEVNLYNVFHSRKLPVYIKNQFKHYTSPGNTTWKFIQSSRNAIVHEKSISQMFPVTIDSFTSDSTLAFMDWDGIPKEVLSFLGQSLRHLRRMTSDVLLNVKSSLLAE